MYFVDQGYHPLVVLRVFQELRDEGKIEMWLKLKVDFDAKEDGDAICAEVADRPGCITQANNLNKLPKNQEVKAKCG